MLALPPLSGLETINDHWALDAFGTDDLARAIRTSNTWVAADAVGHELNMANERPPDLIDLIERASSAFEIAAIEGIDSLLHPSTENDHLRAQARAAAHRVFDLQRVLPVPASAGDEIFHVLHLSAIGYCGERWPDVRRWLREHKIEGHAAEASGWTETVLFTIGDCWLRLFRTEGWDDLSAIAELIANLRAAQAEYESGSLSVEDPRTAAFRLVCLYHWAKASELLAGFMLQGANTDIASELDRHFEAAIDAASESSEPDTFVLLKWLQAAARLMVEGSLWVLASDSSRMDFVGGLAKSRGMFELLAPQRAALLEQGLLDAASQAVVVDLPTSGGKTILAEFRILQALNQFQVDQGWVAYIAPTRALVAQVTRRLRADFGPIGIRVEQMTGAVEIDSFEEDLLSDTSATGSFQVLVATPEKLGFVIRNKKVARPLALLVMDEAHCLEDPDRGLRIELLLATIKSDCPRAHFLLLTPFVPNSRDLALWLAPASGKSISLGTSPWQPNERIVGVFDIERDASARGGWRMKLDPVRAPRTLPLTGTLAVGGLRPLNMPWSDAKSQTNQTGAMATVFSSQNGRTSIAVARTISDVWTMARTVTSNLGVLGSIPDEVALVQRFLATEIGPDYELIRLLSSGVAVHHAAMSDEARTMIEWLAEIGKLRVLCATTTLVNGINFPVSSVFLSSRFLPSQEGRMMSTRSFWNLAGRAGRADQGSVGVVGLCAGNDAEEARKYVEHKTEDLASRLLSMLDDLERQGNLTNLSQILQTDQWADFRSYVAHLVSGHPATDPVGDTDQLLRNTFGYRVLRQRGDVASATKARALLDATRQYAQRLAHDRGNATLADSTGFSPEGVRAAMGGMHGMPRTPQATDWAPDNLFGAHGLRFLSQLVGVMLRVQPLRQSFETDFGSEGVNGMKIAEVAQAWVNGSSIREIAAAHFPGANDPESTTKSLDRTCRAIYRTLSNTGAWGLSALTKMPQSGIDFDHLDPEALKAINSLPARIYHGVNTDAAVLMRMNSVPRSVAVEMGRHFESAAAGARTPAAARGYIKSLSEGDWQAMAPGSAAMSGSDYRSVWQRLSGELS